MKKNTYWKQIKQNAVALISLTIAVSSLSYSTWRNEKTEDNRNQRYASFEILLKLNELQQVVFHHFYDKDIQNKGNIRTGWTYVLTISDLSKLLNKSIQNSSNNLTDVWASQWQDLTDSQASVDAVLTAIDAVRTDSLNRLKSLE